MSEVGTVLGSLRHPHLVGDAASGVPLSELLDRAGGLTGGQVVTLVAPLAGGLAAMHARGIGADEVRLGDVTIAPDGRPLLDVSGTASHRSGAVPWTDDIGQLARLGLLALRDDAEASSSVASVLRRAVDAGGLMSAADFATALLRACPAAALPMTAALHRGSAPTADAGPGRPSQVARLCATGAAVAGLGLAVAVGTAWGNAGHHAAAAQLRPFPVASPHPATASPSVTAPSRATTSPDWADVVETLERRRAAAIRAGDVAALRRTYLPGCAAGRRDVRLLRDLAARGLRVRGLHPSLTAVTVARAGPRPVLRVTDDLSAIRVVDAGNRVVQRRPPRGPATVRLTLARRGGGWVIARVGQPTRARSAASTSS